MVTLAEMLKNGGPVRGFGTFNVTIGTAPQIRIDGKLRPLDHPF